MPFSLKREREGILLPIQSLLTDRLKRQMYYFKERSRKFYCCIGWRRGSGLAPPLLHRERSTLHKARYSNQISETKRVEDSGVRWRVREGLLGGAHKYNQALHTAYNTTFYVPWYQHSDLCSSSSGSGVLARESEREIAHNTLTANNHTLKCQHLLREVLQSCSNDTYLLLICQKKNCRFSVKRTSEEDILKGRNGSWELHVGNKITHFVKESGRGNQWEWQGGEKGFRTISAFRYLLETADI